MSCSSTAHINPYQIRPKSSKDSDFYLELEGNFTGWMERDQSEYAGKRESDSKQSWSEEERLDHLDQAKKTRRRKGYHVNDNYAIFILSTPLTNV